MPSNTYHKKIANKKIDNVLVIFPFPYINPYYALPPIAAEYMLAGIVESGKQATLVDMRFESNIDDHIKKADLVVLSGHFEDCSLFGKWHIHVINEVLEKISPEIPVIASGTGFTVHEEAMKNYPKVDIIIRGNPELPVIDILNGKELEKIENLVFRNGKKIVFTKRIIHALTEHIFPRRDLRNPAYKYHMMGIKTDLVRAAVGCNFRCKFCFEYGKDFDGSYMKWQGRSAQSLYNEIITSDATIIGWVDDDMTTDMVMLGELSDLLLENNVHKLYAGTGRIDHVIKKDLAALKKMEKSGFVALSFGVESLKDETLRFYGKGQNLQGVEKSMEMMKQTNILTICNFILGSPGETESDMMEMLKFGRRWDVDTLVTNRFRMQPDSVMYELIHDKKTGKVKPGMERIDGDELARIKYKIKFGQRTPFRIMLTLAKLYRHKGLFLDPMYLFFSALDTVIKNSAVEKTIIVPVFVKLCKGFFWLPPVRYFTRVLAIVMTPPLKGINYLFELADDKFEWSTRILPKFFLYLKDNLYEKQRAMAQVKRKD